MGRGGAPVGGDTGLIRMIDCHTHAWLANGPVAVASHYVPDYGFTIDQLRAVLRQHAVSRAVLVQTSFCADNNSYLMACSAREPRVWRSLVTVDHQTQATALQGWNSLGARGIRFNFFGALAPSLLQSAWIDPILRKASDLGWHVAIAAPASTAMAAARQLGDYGLKVVFDHWGMPSDRFDRDALWDYTGKHGHFVKLSARYRVADGVLGPTPLETLSTMVPSTHWLWGSDCPFTRHEARHSYDSALRDLKELGITALQEIQLSINARNLYQFD